MPDIGTPIAVPELCLQPEQAGAVKLSDDMQQTLSLLTAFFLNKRVLLKASSSGILYVTLPRLVDTLSWQADGDNDVIQGDDVPCTEVLCRAALANTGIVYVTVFKTPTAANAMPLQKGESFVFCVENLREIQALFTKDDDILIVCHSV